MRVGLECHKPFRVKVVYDPLDVLAIGAEVAGEPRDRLRAFCVHNGAEDLPARTRKPELGHQTVARGQELAVQSEQIEHEVGQGITG